MLPRLKDAPAATLDRICAFLDVEQGVLADLPAQNVTAHAGDSWVDRATARTRRAVTAVEHRLPEPWWRAVDGLLSRHPQRKQRRRAPLSPDERDALLPGSPTTCTPWSG